MAQDDAKTGCGGCCGGAEAPASAPPPRSSGRAFHVRGLDCAEEVATLKRAVGPKVGGEEHLAFDALNGRMIVLDGARPTTDAEVEAAVATTGMSAKPWRADEAEEDRAAQLRAQTRVTLASGALWLAGLIWHLAEAEAAGVAALFSGHEASPAPAGEWLLFAAAAVAGARYVAPKAWSALRRRAPDMNLLMVIAVLGAFGIGEAFEGATVAFFFVLSLTLESWSVGRARNAVAKLMDLAPPTARVVGEDGREREVPAGEVRVGDRFVLRAGDRAALDGEVVEGRGGVNQAPITGESAPALKEPGDPIYAGSINGEGALVVRATKAAGDTVLARIIRMVGEANARRAPVEQWVERFARVYTPVVMGLALLVLLVPPLLLGAAWETWIYNALVLLVLACPCALVISTPVSVVSALAAAARNGVLIKGGAYLEAPARVTAVALDKTGTLTRGEPEAAAVTPLGGATETDVLRVAAALEARSSHPLATAILARAEAAGLAPAAAREARVAPGRGVEGEAEGRPVWLGSERFAREKGLAEALPRARIDAIEQAGSTAVLVGEGDRLIGVIEVRDAVRPEAAEAVAALHRLGVETVVMLTGDNRRTAEAVAARVGIDEVRAELLPEDKVAAIEALGRERKVAMIGDGINDAPAMARADVAVAMGAIGSDAAIETADVALMTDDIGKLPWLIGHSRRALAVIRQNVAFSIGVKVVFAALALANIATLWGAIAADVGASLLVVLNALRLLRPRRGADPGGHGGAAEAEARPAARSGAPAVAAEV